IDKGDGLPGDLHVAFERLARVPLGLPVAILQRAVQPEEELFLGPDRLLAAPVDRLNRLERLEVVRYVGSEVLEEARAEADAQVDALLVAGVAQRAQGALDDAEVRAIGPAQVQVPLVLAHPGEDSLLRGGHESSYGFEPLNNAADRSA